MARTKPTVRAAEFEPARRRANLSPGQTLKTVRELQEMTQSELAQASGIDQSAISAMEHDRVTIGEVRARKLARALRVHPAVILFSNWPEDGPSDLPSESTDLETPIARRSRVANARRKDVA